MTDDEKRAIMLGRRTGKTATMVHAQLEAMDDETLERVWEESDDQQLRLWVGEEWTMRKLRDGWAAASARERAKDATRFLNDYKP